MGIYGSGRITLNIALLDKYPPEGAIPSSLLTGTTGSYIYPYSKESDCKMIAPYYSVDGQPRSPTPEEEQFNKENEGRCLAGIAEDRKKAKINDINQSAFLIFIGAGLLALRKRLA